MRKNRIKSVRIERVMDDMGDTSTIGEYTDKKEDWAICRHCGEYIVVVEAPNVKAEEIKEEIINLETEECDDDTNHNQTIEELRKELNALDLHTCQISRREYNFFLPYAGGEEPGSKNYQEYGKQDFKRMEGLNNGDWSFVGIIAKAEIVTGLGTLQTIRSGGLWGIESDAGPYIDEIGKEQIEELKEELIALGFGKRAINHGFKNVETVDKRRIL